MNDNNMLFRALERYAEFTGRSTRTEYWLFVLVYVVAYIAMLIIGAITFGEGGAETMPLLVVFGCLVPSIAVTVRRLHDTGRSGLHALWMLLPIIGSLVLLVFALLPSDEGTNEYGAPDDGARVSGGQSAPPRYSSSQLDELERLGRLRDSKVLTETEFETRKAQILRL